MKRFFFGTLSLTLVFFACRHDYTSLRGRPDAASTGSGGAIAGSGGETGGTGVSTGGSAMVGSGGTSGPTATGGNAGGQGTGGRAGSGGAPATGSGGRGGAIGGGGVASSGGATNSGGATSSGGMTAPTDGGTSDAVCQLASYAFVSKTPTVYVLVDRSGSMFDCNSTPSVDIPCGTPSDTTWSKLKASVLMVVSSLQSQVRFGFAAFTGTNPASGGTCPIVSAVPANLDNYAAVALLYDGLTFPPSTTMSGMKFEGPARQALDIVGAQVLADSAAGEKYILFVTDGQPDYCDDGNSLCPPDSVIGGLQALKAKGVTTIVMGLQSTGNDLLPGVLQSFANAGAGEPTLAPLRATLDTFSFYDQCNGVAGWHADLVTSGKALARGATVGTYAVSAGPTSPFTPDGTNQTMIENQLSQALSGVKSCAFDLKNNSGAAIKVDLTMLGRARVLIAGATVPQDATNGWSMSSATQLVLNGTACATWRMPGTSSIDFQFPCEAIMLQ